MIRFHYALWILTAICITMGGALAKGCVDVIREDSEREGVVQTLLHSTPLGLSEQKI